MEYKAEAKNMKYKIKDSRFKIQEMCAAAAFLVFVAVAALAFFVISAPPVNAQSCSCADGETCPSECTNPNLPVCSGLGAACVIGTPCPSGDTCDIISGTCLRGVCQPFMPSPSGSPTTYTFISPTGATSFSAIVCAVIIFFSQTILPPLAVLMMLVVGFLFMMGGQMPQKAIAAKKTLLYVVAGVVLLLLAPGILAIIIDVTGASASSIIGPCPGIPMTMDSIVKTITNLINWFSWFVSITSVVTGLYAGLLYLTARGNPSKVKEATKVLSYTIIGVAVAIISFSIIALTKTFFGI